MVNDQKIFETRKLVSMYYILFCTWCCPELGKRSFSYKQNAQNGDKSSSTVSHTVLDKNYVLQNSLFLLE